MAPQLGWPVAPAATTLLLHAAACVLAFGGGSLPIAACGHNLPISRLTIVADEDYVHVEIVVNAEELSFFSELDRDHDRRLSAEELREQGDRAACAIVDCIELRAGGQAVACDSCGLIPGGGGHHLTVRAHFPTDVRTAPLAIASRLVELTHGAHVTEAVFQSPDGRETAVLDGRRRSVTFNRRYDGAARDAPAVRSTATSPPSKWTWRRVAGGCLMAAFLGGFFLYSSHHKRRIIG